MGFAHLYIYYMLHFVFKAGTGKEKKSLIRELLSYSHPLIYISPWFWSFNKF